MKSHCFIYLYLACCLNGFVLRAQHKDTTLIKVAETKEENSAKKRKFIYFISDRISDDDKYDIFKITPSQTVPALIVVRGHLEVIGNPNEKKGKISLYNVSSNELVGIYNTNSYTGNYLMILAPNVKYLFKVEVSGYGTTQEVVEVPLKIDYEICQQDIKIKLNEKKKPILLINSFFADENEKVFYLRSAIDSTKTDTDNSTLLNSEAITKQADKNGKPYSSVDELVKKQTEEERKKPEEALKAFKANDFETALSLYSDLMKNDPGEPFRNYYYGICLLKLERNKAKAINSLRLASTVKEIPYDVFLYLGKACHLSYLFQDALNAFEEYKKRAKMAEIESNQVFQLISNCRNGNALITEQVNIEVVKRSPAQPDNILASYDAELIGEQVKYKTEFFYSGNDKKKGTKHIITNATPREYIHASYGDKETTDLYRNACLPNGTLGGSQLLSSEINTPFDEAYPYLSKDGKTLYFSSKGHNSMGGFDIFKCTREDTLSAWSKPQNMGYPINSTYDDILYIPGNDEQNASFCSNRKNTTLEYIQIKLPQHASASSVIKGRFSTSDSIPKHDAYISVYNSNTGEVAGIYKTNPATGQYLMILVSGIKYDMSVEAEGLSDLNSTFELPDKKGDFDLKQIIQLQTGTQKNLKVQNYFTEAEAVKVSFDVAVQKPEAAKTKTLAVVEPKKENKFKKPKRTPEEHAKDEENLKLAQTLFDQYTYQEAALVYQELDYYIDLEATESYQFGVCLFHSKKDKTNCIKALEIASQDKDIPIDVFYYLAKANHMSYRFNTAINYYKKFASLSKPAEAQKLNIDKEIEYCVNGIKLVNNPVVLEVYGKKHVSHETIQNSLNEIESGAKILVITDDMRSPVDKKKNFKSLLFLSADKNTILYSSYGDNEANGKDIYQLKKLGNGKWATLPQHLTNINSPFDEEYPSLSKDGKTLYFSSKGYENMGSYDIFKSTWDESTQSWSKPVNLGAPVNSPFEDIYFLE